MGTIVMPGLRKGSVTPPASKSHLHRLLIADFLAGDRSRLGDDPADSQDIIATKRCLKALDTDATDVVLDCGESARRCASWRPSLRRWARKRPSRRRDVWRTVR